MLEAMQTMMMSASERKDVMASMSENFDKQDEPKLGIFWYSEKNDELFGVTSSYANELPFDSNGRKTVGTLHKTWWKKQQERAKAKGAPLGVFANDYTLLPRGRVFQVKDGHFELMCGSWINEHIVELVKDEFNLQDVPLEVKIDDHWEIGHGWSEEYL
ncbi:MAG: hypothetical protein LBH44_04525 [Treponema sp.]|jgi:hypothetical protein|nr:hypothetical protein [Treponema sp.]